MLSVVSRHDIQITRLINHYIFQIIKSLSMFKTEHHDLLLFLNNQIMETLPKLAISKDMESHNSSYPLLLKQLKQTRHCMVINDVVNCNFNNMKVHVKMWAFNMRSQHSTTSL